MTIRLHLAVGLAASLAIGGATVDRLRAEAPAAGGVFRDCADCPEMVVIPPGTFTMGSPPNEAERADGEGPQHPVTIAKPFALGKYEVTYKEWTACYFDGGCRKRDETMAARDRIPIRNVSWDDAKAHAVWLSRKTGKAYRLPSEAEWEYGARAGSTTAYPWGGELGSGNANCDGCGSKWDKSYPAPVGSFAANRFGLHDMIGNVAELVEDCDNENYDGAPADGRAWLTGDCSRRVLRGGSYASKPRHLRSAQRGKVPAYFDHHLLGFRVARTID